MAPPADRVYALAREVLDTVVAGYEATAIDMGADWDPAWDLPARQLVSIGPPAWDCGLVAVWIERVYGHPGNVATEVLDPQSVSAEHVLRGAFVRIQIARCVPTLDDEASAPDPDDEEDAAKVLLVDCQLVQNVLRAAEKAGELVTCHSLAFSEWTSVGPDGAMAASTHGYRLGLTAAAL